MARKLPFLILFLIAATAQQLLLGFNFKTGRYVAIETGFAPWMALLQIAVTVEAFRWLSSSLVNFSKYGWWLFALVTGASLAGERLTASEFDIETVLRWIAAIERGVGYSLGFALLAGVFCYKLLGASRAPLWHALCLSALAIGNGCGWANMSAKTVMLATMAALVLWMLTVRAPPSWIPRQPRSYDDEGVEQGWRDAEKKIKDTWRAMGK